MSKSFHDLTKAKLGENTSLQGAMLFPANNPWNMDVSQLPSDPQSEKLIASIGKDKSLHPDFGTVWNNAPSGIPYIVVAGTQKKVQVQFEYPDESDKGPYPIPENPPIEGGPKSDGDRHVIMLDRDNAKLYELFSVYPDGKGGWKAGSGAIFDLTTNKLRPAGWTSADAAGLPILPGLVRYDEVMELKQINHALRFTVKKTRRAYVEPATHFASKDSSDLQPPMGMRVRLKRSINIAGYPAEVQVILTALKKYGMFLADNGSDWFLSGAPDPRWNVDNLRALKKLKGSDFEVVRMGKIVTE